VKNNLSNSAAINLLRGTLVSGINQLAFYVEQTDVNKKISFVRRVYGNEVANGY